MTKNNTPIKREALKERTKGQGSIEGYANARNESGSRVEKDHYGTICIYEEQKTIC
jgi:hypothetical protein